MKTNYLNNRDLLSEIHDSKTSYCSFKNTLTDHQFDIIVNSTTEITKKIISEARENRVSRLERARGSKMTPKEIKAIPVTDLVFRVMTWEHIPLAPPKAPKKKTKEINLVEELELDESEVQDEIVIEAAGPESQTHIKVNFPPFFHYRFNENSELELIGKSHWQGDLETGHFSKTHGNITDKLALMYMKLCSRYSSRANWRGYCVDDQTEALTQRGWLGINDINESDMILSYINPANTSGNLIWSKIKSIYRNDFDGLMHKLTHESIDALITPEHKMVTTSGLVKAEHLKKTDNIIVMGEAELGSDSEDESESEPDTILTMDYILSLSLDQREQLLIIIKNSNQSVDETLFDSKINAEMFQILCTLVGYKTNSQFINSKNMYQVIIFPKENNIISVSDIDFNGGMAVNQQNIPTTHYKGKVWCPETEYGCFLAKRNGKVYLTGNTYNEEMEAQSILQIVQVGLQFNEAKSENPFSYLTMILQNVFTRVLNIEKRNQAIRDDLLEKQGYNPSMARQMKANAMSSLD